MHTISMRIHRFFIDRSLPQSGIVKIDNTDLIHQWRHVLRFQVGQRITLFDNSGFEFSATITSLDNHVAEVEIYTNHNANFCPKLPLFLFLSLAKRDTFEWVLEKGTEIGVSGFTPIISERSEKKDINFARSKKIVIEASEQSGRSTLPVITKPMTLSQAIEGLVSQSNPNGVTFVLDPRGEQLDFKKYSKNVRTNVFVGPEGGFSPAEIAFFKNQNIPAYSLGGQVLRAETASIAIASVLLLTL